jgi:hemolysin activation/secretion protein
MRLPRPAAGRALPSWVLLASACGVMLTTLCATAGFAQGVPAAAGAASREAERSQATAPLTTARPAPVLPQLVEPQLTLDAKQRILIKTIVVDGDQPLGDAAARAVITPFEGRKLTIAEIYALAGDLTNLYRGAGYLVAKTYVPAQNAKSGTLRLKLVVGQWGKVTVQNQSLVSDAMVQATVENAVAGETYIQQDGIERAMLSVNDLAGAGLPKATIAAGQEVGSSNFVFTVPPERRVGGYVMGDNWGAPSTGRARLSGDVYVNSPLGLGDKLDLYGLVSRDKGLVNGRAAYALPLWAGGPRAEVAAFRTSYALGGAYSALDAEGIATGASGTLTYALQRSRAASLWLSANGTWKHLHDEALGVTTSERDIGLGTLALTRETVGELFGLPWQTGTTLSASFGRVSFDEAVLATAAEGGYGRANLAFSATLGLMERLSLTATLRGQTAFGKTLDSSEQFGITGAWGVRSFDEGLSGDSGLLLTPELRWQLPEVGEMKHALGLFADVGMAWLSEPDPSGLQARRSRAQDVGLGYYANWDWSEGRTLFVKAQVARTVGSVEGAERYDKETRGLLQIGTTF